MHDGCPRPGAIYVEGGRVVYAELTGQRGLAAFKTICFLNRGQFKFEPGVRPPERVMHEDGMMMLLESARYHPRIAARWKTG